MIRIFWLALAACLLTGCVMNSSLKSGHLAFQKQDYQASMRNFKKAASEGKTEALFFIGGLYEKPRYGFNSPAKARYYYEESIKQRAPNFMYSLNNLGMMWINYGANAEQKETGHKLLTLAARWNNDLARSNLKKLGKEVPSPDLYYQKEISEIATIFALVGLANASGKAYPPSYTPSASPIRFEGLPGINKRSNTCLADQECGYGGRCVKQITDFEGVCMLQVDEYGTPSTHTPKANQGFRKYGTESCHNNSQCPIGFSCSSRYKVCIKD